MKFLDVKTDFAFKKVFGSIDSKDILISFLNSMIYAGSIQQVKDLTIVDPYTIPMLKGMKDSFVDVKAVLNDGTHVIIEMQVLNHKGLEKRILYNAAKNYSIQLEKGEDYTLLNPVIALTLVDFTMFPNIDQVTSRFKLIEKETMIEYSDDIEMIFVELPKFTASFDELQGIDEQWIYFVKHAGEMDFIPDSFKAPLTKAFSLIDESSMSLEELEAQHKRKEFIYIQKSSLELAEEQGMEKGMEKGMQKGREEIARNLLASGMSVFKVTQLTRLSETQVNNLD
ncbi:MAG: Rpn family recombination-promoting nuclease/putative transposase [Gammaproteobacteria bacterium]|nr:Rpn family recombination-promoting nuclease/putative transposase [Gammaproteobacteria bacterium]